MFVAVLLAALAAFQTPAETGFIAGAVVRTPQETISRPIRVLLLPPQYSNLWTSDVQKRLDAYWERYKPMFAAKKESFVEVSRQAHREAANYVLSRMLRDTSNISDYLKETSDGRFEFKNVPFGDYQILAVGTIGDQDVMWEESINVRSVIPLFLELKKRVP